MNNVTNIHNYAKRKRTKLDGPLQYIGAAILVVLAIIAFAALVGGIVALGGLITMLAWNYGVVALAAACGSAVAKIGFGTAICVNLAVGVLNRIFRPRNVEVKNT